MNGKIHKLKADVEKGILYSEKDWVSSLYNEYVANKISARQLNRIIKNNSIEKGSLAETSVSSLSTKFDILDVNGNMISKKELLKKLFQKAKNGDTLAYIKYEDEIIYLKKLNGVIGAYFDDRYQSVRLDKMLTSDRDYNMLRATKLLKEEWLKNPVKVPESIKKKILELNKTLENIDDTLLVEVIRKSDWVLHENTDMYTVSLLPRKMHAEVTHHGGVGIAKYLKLHMGQEFFERFVNAASSGVAGAIQQ